MTMNGRDTGRFRTTRASALPPITAMLIAAILPMVTILPGAAGCGAPEPAERAEPPQRAEPAERGAAIPDTGVFRIDPVRPVSELRREALAAEPPAERGAFRDPDLVNLRTLDAGLRFDIRYATPRNFMGTSFYRTPGAYLQRPAAEALLRAHRRLRDRGFGLIVFDAYRPWHVTKMFWEATPEEKKRYVADPASGSRHNRGAAVDVSLYSLETGRPVAMPSGYDEFTERAHVSWSGGTDRQRAHRERLRSAMEAEGFEVYPHEWWHFDHETWAEYPILDLTFEEIAARKD